MTGRAALRFGLVALWCLAAAGCARVADEQARKAATAAEPTAAVATPPALPAAAAPEASAAAPVTLADGTQDSIDRPSPATPAQLPPRSASSAESSLAPPELPVAAPATPATAEAARAPDVATSAHATPPSVETLDFTSLVTRLRKTKAINLRTKLAVKNESDDLLEGFRAYHARSGAATLAELRRSYDSLFHKLYSLLQDADPPLAREIDRSHGAIWEILADPTKFSASVLRASPPSSPRA